jgi:hypothetical protein
MIRMAEMMNDAAAKERIQKYFDKAHASFENLWKDETLDKLARSCPPIKIMGFPRFGEQRAKQESAPADGRALHRPLD